MLIYQHFFLCQFCIVFVPKSKQFPWGFCFYLAFHQHQPIKDHTEMNTCNDSRVQQIKKEGNPFWGWKESRFFYTKKAELFLQHEKDSRLKKKAELFLQHEKDSRLKKKKAELFLQQDSPFKKKSETFFTTWKRFPFKKKSGTFLVICKRFPFKKKSGTFFNIMKKIPV